MISFSYKHFVALLKAFPLCPLPRAVGRKNIPLNEPILYVYNHVTRGAEPLFVGLAAPVSPPIRFVAEITVLGDHLIERTRRDIVNSIFPLNLQRKINRFLLPRYLFQKFFDFLTQYFITQMRKFNLIPVYLHEPATQEERIKKRRVNRQALIECVTSLEKNVPVAIAPSGGSTHEEAENEAIQTIVPTLASFLRRKGKVVKIVPCVVKEEPPVTKKTYGLYLADRIWPLRFFKQMLSHLQGKKFSRPRVTVVFLPPLTFPHPYPSKAEKIAFVARLQQMMFQALSSPSLPD